MEISPEPANPALDPLHLLLHNREELFYIAAEPLRTPALAWRRLRLKLRGQSPIGYIGWLGHRNLGDEVVFQVIREAFERFPITPFLPSTGESLLSKLNLSGPGFFRAVLLGGGTLINSAFLESARIARSFGAVVYTVGTGAGSPGFGMSLNQSFDSWGKFSVARRSFLCVVRTHAGIWN